MAIDPRLPHSGDAVTFYEVAIANAINDWRMAHGLQSVQLSTALSTTANRHLVDIVENLGGNMSTHDWSLGTEISGWTAQAPYLLGLAWPATVQGFETLALGRADTTPQQYVLAWELSPRHLSIMGEPAYKSLGMAIDDQYRVSAWYAVATDTPPTIVGTTGNDSAVLTSFADTAIAYEGNDTLSGLGGADILYGNQGEDALFGDTGNDTLFGGQGADLVFGGDGSDALYGNMMNDVVYGATGDDSVFGGQGDDAIYGEAGNDLLAGNLGNDTLNGGAGADTFAFGGNSGADMVADFAAADGDRLSVSGQTWTLGSAADGSALLTLSGGGTVTLAGIAPGTFNVGWIAG